MLAEDLPNPEVQDPNGIKYHTAAGHGESSSNLQALLHINGEEFWVGLKISVWMLSWVMQCLPGMLAGPESWPTSVTAFVLGMQHIYLAALYSPFQLIAAFPRCMPRSRCHPTGLASWLVLPSTQKHVVVVQRRQLLCLTLSTPSTLTQL